MGQRILQNLPIGDNIKKIRKRLGYTQSQVVAELQAMCIQISRSTYSKIECNRCSIPIQVLVGLKELFHTEYADFFQFLP